MSRTRRFLGGLAFGYLNMALVTLVGLWLTAFLLAQLGERDYGLWLIVAQVLAYLILLDIGVVALLPREVAYETGRAAASEAPADLRAVTARTVGIVLWQLPLVAIAAAGVVLFFPTAWAPLRLPFVLVAIGFVLVFPLRVFQGVLRGVQDLAFLGVAQLVSWVTSTALVVVLVLAGLGLYALALGWVAGQVLSAALAGARLLRRFPHAVPERMTFAPWPVVKGRLGKGSWVSVGQIAQVLIAGTDLLIIGRMIGPSAVVLYFCTGKLITVLKHQPQMLMEAAQPGISEMKTATSKARLLTVCTALSQAMLIMSGAVACVVLGVNEGFVRWWVGDAHYGGFALTAAIMGVMLLRHWNVTSVYALFALGRERRIAVTTLVDGAVAVTTQIALTRALGPIGAALGAMAGVVLVSLPFNLRALGQETGSTARLVRAPAPWAWRFALVAVLAVFVSTRWTPGTLMGIAGLAVGIGVTYGVLVAPLALRGDLGPYTRAFLAPLGQRLIGLRGARAASG